jgi:glycosyltransferase involved in cell wall biosynthesis
MLHDDDQVTLFLRQPLDAASLEYLDLPDRIRPVVLRPDMPGIPWENVRLRFPAAAHDVLFCPAYTAPVFYRRPLVVATHSVNEIEHGAHSWRYRQTYARLYRHSANEADAVIVPAETTRRDVERVLGVPAERIHVVPQGADDSFVPMDDAEALAAVRRGFFGEDRPYILFVGKCSVRRNIPLLLEAYARLRREGIPHGLVLFGPNVADLPLEQLAADLGVEADVVQTDGVVTDHHDLVPIYNAADVFVHPSLYEGWSMTTVEALACGTAVVAANRGGLADAVAGHGLLLDELTVSSLADAIGSVLRDDDLRRELERKAFERGRTLRWRQTTQQTLDVLRLAAVR